MSDNGSNGIDRGINLGGIRGRIRNEPVPTGPNASDGLGVPYEEIEPTSDSPDSQDKNVWVKESRLSSPSASDNSDGLIQDQVPNSERMGRVAAGVVHDFNNLILGIMETVREVCSELGSEDSRYQRLQMVVDAARKASALSKRLMSYGRRQTPSHQVINLNEVIAGAMSLLGNCLGPVIQIESRLAPSLGNIKGNQSQIERVLLNLALNARDAMPAGGKLTIETSNSDTSIRLVVADTGTGMDPRTLARIFEPYFTTKGNGKGSGLGLAAVHDIITEHGGNVSATSEPNQGSRLIIVLPRVFEPVGYRPTRGHRMDF